MKTVLSLIFILLILPDNQVYGQNAIYNVEPVVFNSAKYNEFSPAYFGNGLVFCSDRNPKLLVSYSSDKDKAPFKIYYVDTLNFKKSQDLKLFSKELTTALNDGPVTFNKTRDTIVFSRNLLAESNYRDVKSPRNNLGLFFAVFDGKKWGKIRELRINSEWYSVTTPSLSPDGQRLYFASDKQGGYGGSDLYFSQKKNGYWSDPVNLGPVINTEGNESYPFVTASGCLFFSSDGHPGLGGKDIFLSEPDKETWLKPVALAEPVNSSSDDFGLIADSLMEEGFFSSNRDKNLDIYHFTTNYPQLFYSRAQRINHYCFKFIDTVPLALDLKRFRYEWNFGDGGTAVGTNVEHCFPEAGKYDIKLFVADRKTGKQVYLKMWSEVEIKIVEQPFIDCPAEGLIGTVISFSGVRSYLPGYKIHSYTWDFGDGTRANGSDVTHNYRTGGNYNIKLGVKAIDERSGSLHQFSVTKPIRLVQNTSELAPVRPKGEGPSVALPEVGSYDHSFVKTKYSFADELAKGAIFMVEILSSKSKVRLDSDQFRAVNQKYRIREYFLKDQGVYSYVVADELSLMAAYPFFADVVSMGFKESRIRTAVLSDQAEIELNTLRKVYGTSGSKLFEQGSAKFRSETLAYLDQIVSLLNKYPGIRLAVSAYADGSKEPAENLDLSQKRATAILNHFVGRGIKASRLLVKGYGRSAASLLPDNVENIQLRDRVLFLVLNE